MPNNDNSIISKLQITKEVENNENLSQETETFPIGVYSENVIIKDNTKNFSLTQLYNHLKTFFNNGAFSWYGFSLPSNNTKIVDFYQIEEIDSD